MTQGLFQKKKKKNNFFENSFFFFLFREIVAELIDEYKGCESPDYINYGMESSSSTSKGTSDGKEENL